MTKSYVTWYGSTYFTDTVLRFKFFMLQAKGEQKVEEAVEEVVEKLVEEQATEKKVK